MFNGWDGGLMSGGTSSAPKNFILLHASLNQEGSNNPSRFVVPGQEH